jgi:bifunctional DNA-binding transcriptional regulator/antitoxin component of YhaV-PrlF toxin-antitoxin module
MTTEIQMALRGVIVLPKKLRDAYRLKPGTTFKLIDLGEGSFVLTPQRSEIERIADDLREALADKGETLDSMLLTLREKREQYGKR